MRHVRTGSIVVLLSLLTSAIVIATELRRGDSTIVLSGTVSPRTGPTEIPAASGRYNGPSGPARGPAGFGFLEFDWSGDVPGFDGN